MSISNIFPVKIYKIKLPNYKEVLAALESRLNNYRNNFDKSQSILNEHNEHNQFYNIKHNLTFDKGVNYPELEDTKKFIAEHAQLYWNELGYSNKLMPTVHNVLINLSYQDSFLMDHIHAPWPIVASIYLKFKDGHGQLMFTSPIDTLLMTQPISDHFSNHYHYNDIEEGDVIIFPGYLRHRFNQNIIEDERICISYYLGSEIKEL
jgi:uncharacterized protein (TIGR02466 family)